MKGLVFVALAVATPLTAQTAALAPVERAAFDGVRAATIRDLTTMLSSRALEGRGTGQPGGDRAADSLAARMRAFGLAPLGDGGSYLQKVPFVSTTVLSTSSITAGTARLAYGPDFVPGGRLTVTADVTGPLVFVGYGVANPGDLKGKVALLLSGKPARADSGWEQGVNPQAVVMSVAASGAAAILIVPDPAGPPYAEYQKYFTRRSVRRSDDTNAVRVPTVYLAEPAAARLAPEVADAMTRARAGTGQEPGRDLGVVTRVALRAQVAAVTSSNVVGVLRGNDPQLARQAVVFTAHYDAFGKDGAAIYPGAADNALGTAMMLAAAEVLTKGPRPRRSIIFLAVTGEEYGLLGARYWTDHATWPIDSVVADFNYDGIGTETYGPVTRVVGWGGEYSGLGDVMQGVVTATGNHVDPDPFPEEHAFYRSDHFAFVQHGVPALMLLGAPADTGWVHRAKSWLEGGDYHQPGDSVRAAWDWTGPRTLAATGLLIGWRVANADTPPAWLPGVPFGRH